jgi:hypothetical protein
MVVVYVFIGGKVWFVYKDKEICVKISSIIRIISSSLLLDLGT